MEYFLFFPGFFLIIAFKADTLFLLRCAHCILRYVKLYIVICEIVYRGSTCINPSLEIQEDSLRAGWLSEKSRKHHNSIQGDQITP